MATRVPPPEQEQRRTPQQIPLMERVASLMERVAAAETEAVRATREKERTASMFLELHDKYVKMFQETGDYLKESERAASEIQMLYDKYVKLTEDYRRLIHTIDELHAMVDKKKSELQKELDLNVRLSHAVDLKEAQLQAMSEQCKTLALNSD